MNTLPNQEKTRIAIAWIVFVVVMTVAWIIFVFWLGRYLTVKKYKETARDCKTLTTLEHYCPPEDAPILDGEAFSKLIQHEINQYAQEKIKQNMREALQRGSSSTR